MSAVELATAYITVAASGQDLAPSLGRSFRQVEKVADASGKRMGKALTGQVAKATEQDVEKAKDAYDQASKQVTTTVDRQAAKVEAAKRKEEIAQAKVTETLAKYPRESSQVLAAQDRLALASQKVQAAQLEQESATERANKKLDETKKALDDATTSAEQAEKPFMTLGDRIQSALKGDFKGAFSGVDTESKKAADGVVDDFDEAGDESGAGMLDGLSGALLTGGAALGIGASFGELFQDGLESVSSTAKLKAALGLSDADAQTLGKDAAAAYRAGFGDDLATATDATAAVHQYLGADVDTQWATEMSLAMAEAFGTDPQENIKAVSQMIRTGMVDDAQEGFDVLTRGFQSGADKAGDLTDTMGEYGTLFRGLGIDGADAIGLMSQGLNAGARDADKVADAFKEFGIRAIDGSKTTTAAFEGLGLDSGEMAARIAAGGQSARDATQEVLEKLREVEDPAERSAIAVGLFGTQAEDLGGALYALDLDTAATGMGNVAGSTERMSDALAEAQSPFDRIKRSFSDIGTSLGGGMMPALNVFADVIIGIGDFFRANPAVLAVVAAGLVGIGIAAGVMTAPTAAAAFATTGLATALAAVSWPVVLIIAGITALVAALVWFFTQTETGKAIWDRVWTGIKTAAAAVVDWFTTYALPVLQMVWDGIAAGAVWLWQNVLVPAWGGIKTAIGATVDWLVNTAWPFIKGVWDAIAAAAVWLWQSVLQPVWTGIKIAIAIAVTAILTYIDLLKWWFESVIAPVAMWLWNNVMKPVWAGIRAAIGAVVAWFRDTAWPILSTVIGWIGAGFENFKVGLGIIWDFIQDRIINPVVVWFRDTAWPILSTVIEYIKSGFGVMRDSLKAAWKYVKDTVIAPVASWFRDTVGPLFDRVTGGITDAFDTMKTAVKRAWEGIRDTAKVPVEFVVNKIINDAIIGNYNDVASTFGLDSIDDVRLPSGWTRGGILPGQSSWRDGDDQLIAARRGEGVLVSEGLRDRESKSLFLRANHAARTMGTSFADFVSGGFAGGGLVNLRMPFSGSYPRGDGFGARGGAHKGIDWPMPSGALLKAVAAGTVSHSWNPAAGRKLELSIGDGLVAGYHHLSSYIAGRGAAVGAGADVARVGNTGRSSGPHLHFSLRRDGKYVDPLPYLGAGGEAGSGGGGWWNPFTSLWSSLKDKVRDGVGDSPWGDMLFELPKKVIGGAKDWVTDKITALGDWAADGIDTVGGYTRWSPVATRALVREGQLGPKRFESLMRRMEQESSFDPRAVNNWDVNARNGTPSKGLMQLIGPTFEAYRDRSLPNDIFDPLANIVASIRYTLATYGDLEKGWDRAGGYAMGGIVNGGIYDTGGVLDSGSFALNLSGQPEVVLNPAESRAYMAGQASAGVDHRPVIQTGDIYGHSAEDVANQIEKKRRQREALYT